MNPRCLLLASLSSLPAFWVANPAAADLTEVRFEVELPEGVDGGPLLWGLQRNGIEIGRGETRVEQLKSQASGQRSAIEATLPEGPAADGTPVVGYLNINRDNLDSYVPSYGDLWQTVTLKPTGTKWVFVAPRDGWVTQKAGSPQDVLTVHYHRFDGDYRNVSLWTWDEHLRRTPQTNELLPVGRDDFGVVFQVDTAAYGRKGDKIGLLPRLNSDWNLKDGPDRYWSPNTGQQVFLLQNTAQVTATTPDVRPRLIEARLDGEKTIGVRFTHPLEAQRVGPPFFVLATRGGTTSRIAQVKAVDSHEGRASRFDLTTEETLDVSNTTAYTVSAGEHGETAVTPGHVLQDRRRFYDAKAVLGAIYTPEKTTFRVFTPSAEAVWAVVADGPEGDAGRAEHEMKRARQGVWEVVVEGSLKGKYYAYRLAGAGLNPNIEVTDIYAVCTQPPHARSLIVNLRESDPAGFRNKPFRCSGALTDAVIYEMHVRDFTIAANSGVEHRGHYLGLAQAGTHLPEHPEVRTGLEHLKELGVTHVQLMPVQDFDNSNEESNSEYNWGYMPVNFNSPDGWLASSPHGSAKIAELKSAIKALHDAGIGVIMDVVYNHTALHASFEKLVPGYYYRVGEDGQLSNGSGCGNEFRSGSPMARKFILDSLKFWVCEYQVDGFRFDLMALIDIDTMKQVREELAAISPHILVYGEPWPGGKTPLRKMSDKNHVRGTGIGAFNDQFRDAVKGDRDDGPPGFIQVGDRLDSIRRGLLGLGEPWPSRPLDAINYFECHDNLTAWDKLLQSMPEASDEQRKHMMRFGALILFTSQGATFIQAGQEFCRSKQGHHNSYNLPDEINQVDWSLKLANADVCNYFRGMIELRRQHAALRLAERADVEQRLAFSQPPAGKCLICRIDGRELDGESAATILVLLNGESDKTTFHLPPGEWSVHADAAQASASELRKARGQVELPAHSGMLLLQ